MRPLLLVTDLDGTLLDGGARVPPVCLAAIRALREAGGRFTVATGRPTRGALLYPELMALTDLPVISYNGACLYDAHLSRTLWRAYMPGGAAEMLRLALERFPAMGALVYLGEDDATYTLRENAQTVEVCWERESYQAPLRPLESLTTPWNKIVMAGPPEEAGRCLDFIRGLAGGALSLILSEGRFLEITAPGTNKAAALRRLAAQYGCSAQDVIAVGDSRNDLEMLRWAGTGVAVANAEQAVLWAADHVVAGNTAFGVRECIERYALPRLGR